MAVFEIMQLATLSKTDIKRWNIATKQLVINAFRVFWDSSGWKFDDSEAYVITDEFDSYNWPVVELTTVNGVFVVMLVDSEHVLVVSTAIDYAEMPQKIYKVLHAEEVRIATYPIVEQLQIGSSLVVRADEFSLDETSSPPTEEQQRVWVDEIFPGLRGAFQGFWDAHQQEFLDPELLLVEDVSINSKWPTIAMTTSDGIFSVSLIEEGVFNAIVVCYSYKDQRPIIVMSAQYFDINETLEILRDLNKALREYLDST